MMGPVMILRTSLLALCCAGALSLTPLSAAADDNDCALYLQGPGRTSAYDYSLNLLKGNFGYEGQHTCITYEAINHAYLEARQRIVVSQPKGDWKAEDFASVGELILDISINLARKYGLTYEEIEKGLPLIDTSKTLIREVCPPVFSHVECRAGKYRRLDGLCNNLHNPTWGATMAPFQRLIGPLFADGINAPRIAHTGRDLPLSRVVSRTMHPDEGFHDHAGTVMVIAWGQFMDHDYTLTGTPLDPKNRNDPEECCQRPPHLKHPYCNEIRVPDDDYFYRLWGVKCIDFVRGFPSPRPGCRLGSRVPFNTLTGVIDGNTVYGVTDKFARKLRTGYGGLLRMNPVFEEYGLKDLLPLKLDIPDEGCTRPNKNMYCFEAGEIRVNEQLVLTVMHTLMAREHNRVAKALAHVNPHWDDETLYQEARRINIAEIQHITYNEFLPILLGKDVMEKFGLVLEKEGYWNGYDPHVNPDVLDAFAAAAYRFGHSLLPTAVERWSKAHKFIASKRLSDLIRRPYDLYRAGVLDEYVMGLMNQVAQAMDDSITQEVTNHLFKKVGARFGMDLVSFNMQRGREFGLPGYMEFRKFCGLSGAESFQDLFGAMSNDTVRKYETIFEHPIDVDLWSGGVSERPLPGSMLGPTFACIIATQFSYSRRGDRFWYELPNQPSSFTPEQLAEIRKARLARVICDNTDIIDTVQLYPMVLPDHELNPRVPCRSGIIPQMDFTKWAEPAPFHSAKQFITDAIFPSANDTNCEEVTEKANVTCEEQEQVVLLNDNCNCTDNEVVIDIPVSDETAKLANDSSTSTTNTECSDNECSDTEQPKEQENGDTVLKYVYKKGESPNMSKKTTGHPKNSLRKKRSLTHNGDSGYAESSPLIVNYKITHTDGDKPFERIRDVIKNSQLADFNIETRHDTAKHDEIKSKEPFLNNNNIVPLSQDNHGERKEYRNNDKNDSQDDESDERHYNTRDRQRNLSNEDQEMPHSKNNHKALPRDESSEESDDSSERSEYRDEIKYSNIDKNDSPHRNSGESDDERNYDERPTANGGSNKDDSRQTPLNKYSYSTLAKDSNESGENTDSDDSTYPRVPRKRIESENESYSKYPVKSITYSESGSSESQEPNHSDGRGSQESEKSYEDTSSTSGYDSDEKNARHKDRQSKYLKPPHAYSSSQEDEYKPEKPVDLPYPGEENKDYNENIFQQKKKPIDKYVSRDNGNVDRKPYLTKAPILTTNQDESEEEEAIIAIMRKKNKTAKEKPYSDYKNADNQSYTTRPLKIKNDDLDDFSYERIHVNDKGLVETVKDTRGNDGLFEIIPSSTSVPIVVEENIEKYSRSLETNDNPNSAEISKEIIDNPDSEEISKKTNKPININDGDVRPVVELSKDSVEVSDLNNRASLKTKTQNEDTSLETLLGVKLSDDSNQEHNEKKIESNDRENVKQQFERIPLNYNHDSPPQNNNHKHKTDENDTETEVTDEEQHNQSNLDILKPEDHKYDEKLNIKFDDIAISLPEIKLPEDILSYAYEEEPHHEKDNKEEKPKYDHTSDEYIEEDAKTNKNEEEENSEDLYHRYPSYYGEKKSKNYKKKQQDEDDEQQDKEESGENEEEDLYEKFVRERFGKRGSFAKRSGRYVSPDHPVAEANKELFQTLKQVLKKTEDLQDQAKKSGDPNAGYMWTLEYGQKLP